MADPSVAISVFTRVPRGGDDAGSLAVPSWSDDDWKQFLAYAKPVTLRAGDVLIRKSASERALYLVASGRLDVLGDDHGATPIATIGPGAVVGEIAFLDARPRTATVSAVDDCELWKLEYEDYQRFVAASPRAACDFALALGCVLAQRLRRRSP